MLNYRFLPIGEDGKTTPFTQQVDLSHIRLWGFAPFNTTPASVTGTLVEQLHDEFQLEYNVETTSVLPCARCLTHVTREHSFHSSHILGANRDDVDHENVLEADKGRLNLTRLVGEDLLFQLEETTLCTTDCKGLCPQCGCNHNKKPCDCVAEEQADPRFNVLRELLGK